MSKANISFCHPKSDGGGSAIRAEMHYQIGDEPGFIRFLFSNQEGEGFDFDHAICCDLKIDAVSQVIHSLEGRSELVEPIDIGGAKFAVKKCGESYAFAAVDGRSKSNIVLKPYEATGLRCSLEQAMFFLSFVRGINP